MKIKYTKDLRGKRFDSNIVPINITIEKLLQDLERVNWNVDALSVYQKKLYKYNKFDRIIDELRASDFEKNKNLIRNNILSLYGDEIGNNYCAIYLVSYSLNQFPETNIFSALKNYFNMNKVQLSTYQIRTIASIGLKDGNYLGILNEDGSISNINFLNKWTYVYANNTFEDVITNIDNQIIKDNKFLIYQKIKTKNLNFLNSITKDIIKQQGKIRKIYKVKKDSNEEIAFKYLKRRLDSQYNINYANRNSITRELFSIIDNIGSLGDFTILRYDFKNFFESIDAMKIYKDYIKNTNLYRFEKELLEEIIRLYPYCYAGIPTSNALVEIIANRFDQAVQSKLRNLGMFFYARYVDDGILIFNQKLDKDYIIEIISKTISEVFEMKSVKLNLNKLCYLTKHSGDSQFNYLGYQFQKDIRGNKLEFKFGIATSKMQKYKNRLNRIIYEYNKNNDVELFRQRIQYFISRIVFYTNTNSRFSTIGKWDVNGITENYSLLSKYLKNNRRKVIKNTEKFLDSVIINECSGAGLINNRLPYFLRGKGKVSYSLAYGLINNKTIIFHPNIGWSAEYLKEQLRKLNPALDLKKKSYKQLSKLYCSILVL